MVCPQSRTQNHDSNRFCTNCGFDFAANWSNANNQNINPQPDQWQGNQRTWDNYQMSRNKTGRFKSHLAMSIVAIFFFTILGIIAIVMSNQANKAYNIGDFEQAESKSNTAMTLSIISYVVGGLLVIVRLAGTF